MSECFNPHPTRRLGAIARHYYTFKTWPCPVSILTQPEGWVPSALILLTIIRRWLVSILTQPEGWVPCQAKSLLTHHLIVSILTQPEGWVPSIPLLLLCAGQGSFNPHPTRRLGAIVRLVQKVVKRWPRFNPHPTRRLGAMFALNPKIRHHGRFQSSPNPKVGCHLPKHDAVACSIDVSILTQPEGWVP